MFSLTTFSIALLTAVASAAPSIEARVDGSGYVSVGNKYSGKGCNPSTLIYADPIFGDGNACQPLSRFATDGPINSYETLRNNAGCSVTLYTGAGCTGTAFSAPVGGCVSGDSPFVSTFVTCTST